MARVTNAKLFVYEVPMLSQSKTCSYSNLKSLQSLVLLLRASPNFWAIVFPTRTITYQKEEAAWLSSSMYMSFATTDSY
jgi:hypothetical protein